MSDKYTFDTMEIKCFHIDLRKKINLSLEHSPSRCYSYQTLSKYVSDVNDIPKIYLKVSTKTFLNTNNPLVTMKKNKDFKIRNT